MTGAAKNWINRRQNIAKI